MLACRLCAKSLLLLAKASWRGFLPRLLNDSHEALRTCNTWTAPSCGWTFETEATDTWKLSESNWNGMEAAAAKGKTKKFREKCGPSKCVHIFECVFGLCALSTMDSLLAVCVHLQYLVSSTWNSNCSRSSECMSHSNNRSYALDQNSSTTIIFAVDLFDMQNEALKYIVTNTIQRIIHLYCTIWRGCHVQNVYAKTLNVFTRRQERK